MKLWRIEVDYLQCFAYAEKRDVKVLEYDAHELSLNIDQSCTHTHSSYAIGYRTLTLLHGIVENEVLNS